MLEVTEGNRVEVGDTQRWYAFTGTVDAGTREIEVPGDTWKREELSHIGPLLGWSADWLESWAV